MARRGSNSFRRNDGIRALKIAKDGGLEPAMLEVVVAKDGSTTFRVYTDKAAPMPTATSTASDEWTDAIAGVKPKGAEGEGMMTNFRLRYVKSYIDRHGKVRHYLRRPGAKPIALPGLARIDRVHGGLLARTRQDHVAASGGRCKPHRCRQRQCHGGRLHGLGRVSPSGLWLEAAVPAHPRRPATRARQPQHCDAGAQACRDDARRQGRDPGGGARLPALPAATGAVRHQHRRARGRSNRRRAGQAPQERRISDLDRGRHRRLRGGLSARDASPGWRWRCCSTPPRAAPTSSDSDAGMSAAGHYK